MISKSVLWKCITLAALMGATLAMCWAFPNAATDPQTGMVLELPETIPGHTGHHREPGEKELEWLPEDTGILKRLYQPVDSESPYEWISATLILSGNDPRSLHRPEVCLDGQGWRIIKREVVELDVDGQPLEVMDYWLERTEKDEDGELFYIRTHYVYWWIGKSRSTPHDWQRILYTDLDNLLRNVNNRWGYPSVMVQVDPTIPDQAQAHREAQERAYEFIRNYAPVFQKSFSENADSAERVASSP